MHSLQTILKMSSAYRFPVVCSSKALSTPVSKACDQNPSSCCNLDLPAASGVITAVTTAPMATIATTTVTAATTATAAATAATTAGAPSPGLCQAIQRQLEKLQTALKGL